MRSAKRQQAVVIGRRIGGLLAARVLARHFVKVTIVGRDAFPKVGEQRRGVPQDQHTHGLLASERQVPDKLFPSLMMELIDAGALPGDIVRRPASLAAAA